MSVFHPMASCSAARASSGVPPCYAPPAARLSWLHPQNRNDVAAARTPCARSSGQNDPRELVGDRRTDRLARTAPRPPGARPDRAALPPSRTWICSRSVMISRMSSSGSVTSTTIVLARAISWSVSEASRSFRNVGRRRRDVQRHTVVIICVISSLHLRTARNWDNDCPICSPTIPRECPAPG